MPEINWNLLHSPAEPVNAFFKGAEMGRQARADREARQQKEQLRGALAAYTANPDDKAAFATIMQNSPELAMKLTEHNDKRQFNSALGDYLSPPRQAAPSRPTAENVPPPNALAGQGALSSVGNSTAAPGRGALNALMPQEGIGPGSNGQQVTPPGRPDAPATASGAAPAEDGPDLSFLGKPETPRDEAFLRMLRRDPEKALKIQSTLRDNFLDQLKDSQSFYGIAVEELARVRDDAGWQAALGRLAPYADRLGVDLSQSVPLDYPGEDEVAALMERAMPIKDRLAHLLRSADIDADNARADRNVDSLVEDRQGRRAETRRYHDQTDRTRRRGQDTTATTARRGQDNRGKVPTATDGSGNTIYYRGGKWVDGAGKAVG